MTYKLLDGAGTARKIREAVSLERERLKLKPSLATILVGEDPASKTYVDMKQKACGEAGFKSTCLELPSSCGEGELLSRIDELNAESCIHGILVQLPLPGHINVGRVLSRINPQKDVDGFNPLNMGALMAKEEAMVAATPLGVMRLLDEYKIECEGADVVIVNHSAIVGRPLSMLFLNRNATVTVCHVKTRNLASHTRRADILVSAAGVPKLIGAEMVGEGAVVVDVGISKKDGKILGDVDFDDVKNKASYISPVPGGAGPMTIAALLENTLNACKKQGGIF
jgi:methylenetetrahydrofolate dehydrogenase (NADP+) / methenyltetrahydrofolate cyclohydrolase